MLWCLPEPRDHTLQEPLQTNPHGPTNPAQRNSFQQEPFNQHALFFSDRKIFWRQD
jgi:hypothetical protein